MVAHTSHGFFNHWGSSNSIDPQAVFVDVGGLGDCGFRAIAAGLIDHVLAHAQGNEPWLKKLLPEHFTYFPAHRSTLPGLNLTERMQQLVKNVRMGELIPALAFTLRQLAVTEMSNHPELYRGAFVSRHEGTTPAEMRKSATWIDESSIAAVANALAVSIDVQVVDRLKTVPMRLRYHDVDTKPPLVVMQLQNGHYTPRVHAIERFRMPVAARVVQPVTDQLPLDRDLAAIVAEIAAADKHMMDTFDATYHRLSIMASAGELTKDDLLASYVKGMASSDYLSGRVAYVGIEHGTQSFFDAINHTQRGVPKAVLPLNGEDAHLISELVHALARAIAIGHMKEDELFVDPDESHDSKPR